MRIFDENNKEIQEPDFKKGYLREDKLFVAHHEATPAIPEQFHYETIATYPNGGKDIRKVIDVPKVKAKEAWDEYEDIFQYVLYTPEQLAEIEAERNKPTDAERISELEEALELLLSGVTE